MPFDPSLYRAYDIRGIYPSVINEEFAYICAQAFARVMNAKRVAVGRDVRLSGPTMQKAAMQGLVDLGVEVIDLGVISTEMLYFASGTLDIDGGFALTASHNPREWNGFKFVGKKGQPLVREGKLGEIYADADAATPQKVATPGTITETPLLAQYAEYLQQYVPADLPSLKVVGNVNFGANGKFVDAAIAKLPLEMIRLNWNEDGGFPKGTPDPLLPSNRIEVCERIVTESADFGVAWDADADRCFFYDEKGRAFAGYYINALLIEHFLKREPGAAVVIEPRQIWATEAVAQAGQGKAVTSRTGHGFIKATMRQANAIFGGENSGHFYYRDFWYCDNGIITFLTVMGLFAEQIKSGGTVSQLLDAYKKDYPASEEMNFITPDAKGIIAALQARHPSAELSQIDGVSLAEGDWRCNLRMSQNEPVLRLNVEARTPEALETREADLLAFILGNGATLRDDH
ncbi:phosphomannomutase/phosphoglucomutase [Armatimonas sp.]|uniref:phosphomannomutase/phosphoglucomutase n=1 Tax=Armatimonas sp. TaxID=1872638 RepID=UPI00286A73BC|nr:phosphomannomutase/phosphoglucomutase [Armatimonas sp.]